MADEEEGSPRIAVPGLIQDLVAQLRGVTEGLEGLAGFGGRVPPAALSGLRNLPRPGALSAGQLGTIATTVAAQRRSIEALQAQLTAFDEQLAVLEQIIAPLADWSKTWADLEQRLMTLRRGAEPEGSKGDELG
jgi:hypothetical protein